MGLAAAAGSIGDNMAVTHPVERCTLKWVRSVPVEEVAPSKSGAGAMVATGAGPIVVSEHTLSNLDIAAEKDKEGCYFIGYVEVTGFAESTVWHTLKVRDLPNGEREIVYEWIFDIPLIDPDTGRPSPTGVPSKTDSGSVDRGMYSPDVLIGVTGHTGGAVKRWNTLWGETLENAATAIAPPANQGYVPGPEPCVLPKRLKYFRPGTPVRRDQQLLMVYRVAGWVIKELGKLQTLFVQYARGQLTTEQLAATPLPRLPFASEQKFQDILPPEPGKAASELYLAAQFGAETGLAGGYPCTETVTVKEG